jgi:hypothetical protein
MLGNTLPGGRNPVLHGQSSAQFEQGLAVTLTKLVQNGPPDRRRDRFEDVVHCTDNRQAAACLSSITLTGLNPDRCIQANTLIYPLQL